MISVIFGFLISVFCGLVARAPSVVPDATYTTLWRSSHPYNRDLIGQRFGTHSRALALFTFNMRLLCGLKTSPCDPIYFRLLLADSLCEPACGAAVARCQASLLVLADAAVAPHGSCIFASPPAYCFDTVLFHMRREASL